MEQFEESEMVFGPYPEDAVFRIEKSPQYTKSLMPNGVKSCEFILSRGNDICFVEAKKSCPNQITANTPEEKKRKYKEYIDEITDKMRHSLALYASILLRRYDTAGIPAKLLHQDLSNKNIKLILVVKNAEDAWLVPLQDALSRSIRQESRIWKCAQFFVINEARARDKRFCCEGNTSWQN